MPCKELSLFSNWPTGLGHTWTVFIPSGGLSLGWSSYLLLFVINVRVTGLQITMTWRSNQEWMWRRDWSQCFSAGNSTNTSSDARNEITVHTLICINIVCVNMIWVLLCIHTALITAASYILYFEFFVYVCVIYEMFCCSLIHHSVLLSAPHAGLQNSSEHLIICHSDFVCL